MHSKGEKISAKAHGGPIDVQGLTVAHVDEGLRVQKLETWFDPLAMFRQIAPDGIVNKEVVDAKVLASKEALPLHSTATTSEQDTPAHKDFNRHLPLTGESHGGDVASDFPLPSREPQVVSAVAMPLDASASDKIDTIDQQHIALQVQAGPTEHTPTEHGDLSLLTETSLLNGSNNLLETLEVPSQSTPLDEPAAKKLRTEDSADSMPVDSASSAGATTIPTLIEPRKETKDQQTYKAYATSAGGREAKFTYDEMSKITSTECPFLNKE